MIPTLNEPFQHWSDFLIKISITGMKEKLAHVSPKSEKIVLVSDAVFFI